MNKHLTISVLYLGLFVLFVQEGQVNAQSKSTYLYCKAVLLENREPDSAFIYLDSATLISNSASFCLLKKAELLLKSKRYSEAKDVYKILETTHFNLAKLGLARCEAAQNKATAALVELDTYLKTSIPLPENKIRFDTYFKTISDSITWVNFWKLEHYTQDQLLAKDCIFMSKSGQRNEAIDILNKRLRKAKTIELFYARGFIYREMKLYDAALLDYRKAVKANSHNSLWLAEFAEVLANAKQNEECLRVIKQALAIEPSLFNLYILNAKVLNETNKEEEAIAELDFYLSLFPADASIWELKSQIYTHANLLLPALVAINKALSLQSDNCTWRYQRARLFIQTGVLQRGLLDLDAVLLCQPENAEAWFIRGELNAKLNKKDAACSDWKQAASLGYLEAFKRTEHICIKQ